MRSFASPLRVGRLTVMPERDWPADLSAEPALESQDCSSTSEVSFPAGFCAPRVTHARVSTHIYTVNGKVYMSAPPGYPEDPDICYLLHKPLYDMPSAAWV